MSIRIKHTRESGREWEGEGRKRLQDDLNNLESAEAEEIKGDLQPELNNHSPEFE